MTIFNIAITMDIVCAAISMAGSLLVARYDRWSYLGWMAWLVANVLWIVWAFTAPTAPVWGVVAQNVFFFYTSVKGYLACRKSMKAAVAPASAPSGLPAST
ncbi:MULTISPECIES: hypothetical protein [unclassified Variovorax]|uniref:hypothetical protein n=1 Tax=unclassified Variovorax TaxID=663243 RepID=UPI00076C9DD6|nr:MULTISPECIES: hypothetical protein [unclassified Variovorax]KWT67014.1 hypothetical protein APY03_7122 [Variovorax sp. WDL1]PNG49139.1 hypothetical protein CHC06_06376 [Variovorax sp. B2]PNG49524.1 hypothetical protein CHC07_06433 [Variovorax sp. B4]VTV18837.1 hypothetical protein WDL1P2_00464 [Variovorax sp. WDL1]